MCRNLLLTAAVATIFFVSGAAYAQKPAKNVLPYTIQRDTQGIYWIFLFRKAASEMYELYTSAEKEKENKYFCIYGTIVKSSNDKGEFLDGLDMIRIERVEEMDPACSTSKHYLGIGRTGTGETDSYEGKKIFPREERLRLWNRVVDYLSLIVVSAARKEGRLTVSLFWSVKDGRGKVWHWKDREGDEWDESYALSYAEPRMIRQKDTRSINAFRVEDEAARFMAQAHERGRRERKEQGFCLYGNLRIGDDGALEAVIRRVASARVIEARAHKIYYYKDFCDFTPDYLGRGHVHVVPDPRTGEVVKHLSRGDLLSFWRRQDEVLTLVVWGTQSDKAKEETTIRMVYRFKHGFGGHINIKFRTKQVETQKENRR